MGWGSRVAGAVMSAATRVARVLGVEEGAGFVQVRCQEVGGAGALASRTLRASARGASAMR